MVALGVLVFAAYGAYGKWIPFPSHPKPIDRMQRYPCTVYAVIDGDTLDCREGHQRVRLLLIDAPEIEQQSFGVRAAQYLKAVLPRGARAQLELDRRTHDKYGRLLAYVWLPDGRLVNEEIVRAGYAIAFVLRPNVKYRERIRRAQRSAKATRSGLWAVGGFACAPVDFRHGRCR
jgi:micrococcal nuclease